MRKNPPMSRAISSALIVLGILLGVTGLVIAYTVGVISDNPLAEDGVARGQVTLLLLCAGATGVAGGAVCLVGIGGLIARNAHFETQ